MKISRLSPGVSGNHHEILIDLPNIEYETYMNWSQTGLPLDRSFPRVFPKATSEELAILAEITPFDKITK